jgi:dienelactone hydrolase
VTAATLVATPVQGLVDVPTRIAVGGLPPGAEVTLRARTVDGACQHWESWATFRADGSGAVVPDRHGPTAGTYTGVAAGGLLWSMEPVDLPRRVFFARHKPTPQRIRIRAEVGGQTVARTEIIRSFDAAGPPPRPVRADGLVGTFFPAAHGRSAAAVLVLSGSDGGQLDHAAALLAARGYAVLSLGYFGVEDRPAHLHHIDLEYFGTALDWLFAQPEVSGDRAAVIGLSRGGELALQLGACLPAVGAVVAGAPSSIRQAGLTAGYSDFTQPSWLLDGEPLPFVPGRMSVRTVAAVMAAWMLRRPLRQRRMFERGLRHRDAPAAEIEVERIDGPVLLVSGGADQLWPSAVYATRVLDRLRALGHRHQHGHLHYPEAGHFVCYPYALPSLPPLTTMAPAGSFTIDFGGTVAANAAAAEQSWPEILGFLHRWSADRRPG